MAQYDFLFSCGSNRNPPPPKKNSLLVPTERQIKYKTISINKKFARYNQKDTRSHNLFISVRRSTCFRRVFRPSSGVQNCTYSVRYWSDKYLTLYVQFRAPDDGRKTRLKHVESLTEINKLRKAASCWLYSENILLVCLRDTLVGVLECGMI